MTVTTEAERNFADFLTTLADPANPRSRGALAALRRGLGKSPGGAPGMFPYLVPWTQKLNERDEEPFYLIASLFALHPLSWPADAEDHPSHDFGASMRVAQPTNPDLRAGIDRRFVALLNSDNEDVGEHLRQAVHLCKAKNIPVDWAELLHDVRRWDSMHHGTQRKWARTFWREAPPNPPDGAADETNQDIGGGSPVDQTSSERNDHVG